MKKEKKIMSRLLACGLAAILPVASGMSVRAEESDESSSDAGKEETVYIFTDADGNPEKTVVSNWLKNPDGSKTLKDSSDLSDIKNVEGDETYTQSGNQLTWQADGSDIYYQGTTSKQAPVSVKLSYQLDGKDISSDDLAGKSGHVKIRFDYENNATKTVTVGGKREEVKVPFAMVSGIILPVDNFKNVTVTNGRVLSEGKSNIVVGMAFPGLKESLNMDSASFKNNIGDYNIPEYVEIEADATDFSLGMTLTVASTDIISKLKDAEDGKVDTSGITDSINELTDASSQLVDGVQQLKDGTSKLRNGTNDLANGGGKLKDGAGELAGGLNTFDASLRSNLQSTKASFAKDSAKAEADKNAIVKMLNSMGVLNADGTVNQQTMAQLKMLSNMANSLINSGLLQVAGIMDADGNLTADADQRTTQLVNLLQALNQSGALQALGLVKSDGTLDIAKLQEYLQMAAQYGSDLGLLDENGKVKPNAADIVNGYAAGIQQIMKDTGLLTADGKLADDAAMKLANLDKMITDLKVQNVLTTDDTGALTLNPTYAELLNNKALISLAQDKNLNSMLTMAQSIGLIKAGEDGTLSIDQTALNNLSAIGSSGILTNGDLDATAKALMGASGIIGSDGKYNQANAQALLKMADTLINSGLLQVAGIMDADGNLTADADQRTTQLVTLLKTLNGSGALSATGLVGADGMLDINKLNDYLKLAQQYGTDLGLLNANGTVKDNAAQIVSGYSAKTKKLMSDAGLLDENGKLVTDAATRIEKLDTLITSMKEQKVLVNDQDGALTIDPVYASLLQNKQLISLAQDPNMNNMLQMAEAAGLITATKDDAGNDALSIDEKALGNLSRIAKSGILVDGDLEDTAKQLMGAAGIMGTDGKYNQANAQALLNMVTNLQKAGLMTSDGQLSPAAKQMLGTAGVLNKDGSFNAEGIAKLENEAQLASQLEAQGILTSDGQLSPSLQSTLVKTGVMDANGEINQTAMNNLMAIAGSGVIVNGDLDATAKSLMNETGIMSNGSYNKDNAQYMLDTYQKLEKLGIIKDGKLTSFAQKVIDFMSRFGAKQNSFAVLEDEDLPAEDTPALDQTEATESDQTDDQVETVTPDENTAAEAESTDAAADTDTAKADDSAASDTNDKTDAPDTTAESADDSQSDSAEVESLKQQLADAQSQLDAANAKASDLQTQLDDANAKNADVKKQLDDANAKNADLQTQLNNANSAKDDAYNQGYAAAQADAAAAAASQAPAANSVETTDTAFIGSASDYVVSTASVSFSLDQVNQLTDLIKQFLADYGQAAGEAGAVKALESILNNADYQKLIAGGTTLSNGTNELYDGILKLRDGAGELDNGAQDLLEGMQKFDSEGIQKLADVFGNDLPSVIDRLDALVDAGADYTSFTGNGNANDSVKFVIKTSEVGTDSAN